MWLLDCAHVSLFPPPCVNSFLPAWSSKWITPNQLTGERRWEEHLLLTAVLFKLASDWASPNAPRDSLEIISFKLFVLGAKVVRYLKFTADMTGRSRWKAQCHCDNQSKGNWPQPEPKWISRRGKNCMWCIIIIFLLGQKCFVKHLLQRAGIADDFLTGIMCSKASSSACCLYKYLEPQSRGHVGRKESSGYSNSVVLACCKSFI